MKKVILVVEDDRDILTVLKDHLELDGFKVLTAETGKEALEILESERVDLVVLDINLPDTDGFKVCCKVKEKKDIPVIILTVRETLQDKLRGFDCGADDYLVKPFEYLELLARIKVRLKSRGQELEDMEFGRIKIVPSKRMVYKDGKPVKLTKKEFELITILARHAGEVLSREYIKDQLWRDKTVYPWSRALDVHIKNLREKIEDDPENPRIIVTHPGVGYSFNPEG